MSTQNPHICVCICTYKRPELLRRTLEGVARQETDGAFRFSIVVADNDAAESARSVVSAFTEPNQGIAVRYYVEPRQNIALARNRALAHAEGDYLAFIDDDEFPDPRWLHSMLAACRQYNVDGVLGPVRPFFDQPPPRWLTRGKFCERPEHPSGMPLHWRQTRTGNVLLRSPIIDPLPEPFRREFGNGGEDQDLFRRLIGRGHRFAWCNEGVVHEVVPPERWTRKYLLKRALLRGQNEKLLLSWYRIAKAAVAVPSYAATLPFAALLGQHRAMSNLVKMCDHVGLLLAACGRQPLGEKYLSG